MGTTTTLKAYLNNLDALLESESPTEVVGHCRYILQHYPQNVETYRLLGKALLQKGHQEGLKEHFDEAAQLFLRVLTVFPNDHVAHLGLSEIRQQEGDLNKAIWHLERAYEQMPGNAVLQEALRNLYVKRDGQAPGKIQLTRAALARQYAVAQLYDQALMELWTALDQDPSRIDLQALLAQTLWESHHPVEAGEMALQVLKKLPNCLPANRILAQLWIDYDRPTDAQIFLDRLEALDPYEAAQILQPNASLPDPNVLERLDYSAKAAARLSTETPDWVQDLGDLGGPSMDDIFKADAPAQPQMPPAAPPPLAPMPGGIDMNAIFGGSDWATAGESSSPSVEDVPDWFSGVDIPGAGNPPVPVPPPGSDWFTDQADWGAPPPTDEQPSVTGDVPDWFAEVMNTEPASEPPAAAPLEADWLGEELPEPEDADRLSSGFTGLLQGIPDHSMFDAEQGGIEPTPPEWLQAFEEGDQADKLPAADSLTWLDQEAEPELSTQAEAESLFNSQTNEPTSARPEITWDAAETGMPVEEIGQVVEDDPMAWMRSLEFDSKPVEAQPDERAEADLDALRRASMPPADFDSDDFWGELPSEDTVESAGAAADEEAAVSPVAADDWLAEPEYDFFTSSPLAESPAPSQTEAPLSASGDDWLADMEMFEGSELVQIPIDTHTELPAAPNAREEQPLAQQDEQALETGVPDWLGGAAPVPAESEAASFDELFGEEHPLAQQDEQALETGVPDWLGGAAPAVAERDVTPLDILFEEEQPLDTATLFQGASQELDWLPQQPPAEEDWLGSFAKSEESFPSVSKQEDAWLVGLPSTEFEQPSKAAVEEEFEAQQELSWKPAVPDLEASIESPADIFAQQEVVPAELSASSDDNLLGEPYDPFAAGRADQVPTYQAAKETGILQPDEVLDWMAAFSDEETPLEMEEEAATSSEGELVLDWENLNIGEPKSVEIEEERLPEAPVEDVLGEVEMAISTPVEELEDDSGEMPEWLLAITQSEADKLEDLPPVEEPETYLSAQETGVLQPGRELDWLAEDLDEVEPAPADLLADLERVAQPADMTDTREVVLEEETDDSFTFSFEDESVPDDFSFEEVQPAWLRHPREDEQKSTKKIDKASNVPEWLRNAFEGSDTE